MQCTVVLHVFAGCWSSAVSFKLSSEIHLDRHGDERNTKVVSWLRALEALALSALAPPPVHAPHVRVDDGAAATLFARAPPPPVRANGTAATPWLFLFIMHVRFRLGDAASAFRAGRCHCRRSLCSRASACRVNMSLASGRPRRWWKAHCASAMRRPLNPCRHGPPQSLSLSQKSKPCSLIRK